MCPSVGKLQDFNLTFFFELSFNLFSDFRQRQTFAGVILGALLHEAPASLFVVVGAVVAGVEVVQVGGHLGLQLVLDQESVHAAVEELGSEAVVPRKIYKS